MTQLKLGYCLTAVVAVILSSYKAYTADRPAQSLLLAFSFNSLCGVGEKELRRKLALSEKFYFKMVNKITGGSELYYF